MITIQNTGVITSNVFLNTFIKKNICSELYYFVYYILIFFVITHVDFD